MTGALGLRPGTVPSTAHEHEFGDEFRPDDSGCRPHRAAEMRFPMDPADERPLTPRVLISPTVSGARGLPGVP